MGSAGQTSLGDGHFAPIPGPGSVRVVRKAVMVAPVVDHMSCVGG